MSIDQLIEFLKIFFSPLVIIVIIIFIAFLSIKNDLIEILKNIKIKINNNIIETASKEESSDKIFIDNEKQIRIKKNYIFRSSITFILSGFIKFEERENYCKEALKIFKDEILIQNFNSNIIIKDINLDKNENKNYYTRIHFFILSNIEINPSDIKNIFDNHFKKNNLNILDYIIMREQIIIK